MRNVRLSALMLLFSCGNLGASAQEFGMMYWDTGSSLMRARPDGVGEELVIGGTHPTSIAFDLIGRKVYFRHFNVRKNTRSLRRANFNGSAMETVADHNVFGSAVDSIGQKLYWATRKTPAMIQRANLDGSSVEDLASEQGEIDSIELDLKQGKMYWANLNGGTIRRANLDGSEIESLFPDGTLAAPRGLALDLARGRVIWSERQGGRIQSANLDGSDVRMLLTTPTPEKIAVDWVQQKIYWTNQNTGIHRANLLDGSDIENVIAHSSIGFALANPFAPCLFDACDVNCDGEVNVFDIEPFLDVLFTSVRRCGLCAGDVDGNGVVDAFDIEPFLNCLFP